MTKPRTDFGLLTRAGRSALQHATEHDGRINHGAYATAVMATLTRRGYLHHIEGPTGRWWEMPLLVTGGVPFPTPGRTAEVRHHRGEHTIVYRVASLPATGSGLRWQYVVTIAEYRHGQPLGRHDPHTAALMRHDNADVIKDWLQEAAAQLTASGYTCAPTGAHDLPEDAEHTTEQTIGSVTVKRVYRGGRLHHADLYMGAGWLRATVHTERGINGAVARLNA